MAEDRLESFGIYRLAYQLFEDFWTDSEIVGKDYRGRELVKQQTRSLDSVCANIEEGYGRGFNKEMPQHLKILLPVETVTKRVAALDQIIGGLTNTIISMENKRKS